MVKLLAGDSHLTVRFQEFLSEKVAAALYGDLLKLRFELIKSPSIDKSLHVKPLVQNSFLGFDFQSEEITINYFTRLRNLIFGIGLISLLIFLIFLRRNRELANKKVTLVFGFTNLQIYEGKDVARFHHMLSNECFDFSHQTDVFLVESRKLRGTKHNQGGTLLTTYDNSIYLYRHFLNVQEKIRLILSGCALLFREYSFHRNKKSQLGSFAIKELILDFPVGKKVSQGRYLHHLVITPSNLFSKPGLYFSLREEQKSSMVWYSANSLPIEAKNEFSIWPDMTYLTVSHADTHYVWTETHCKYLAASTPGTVKCVGVISPNRYLLKPPSQRPGKFQIAIFDVTPVRLPHYQEGFYSESRVKCFIDEIVLVKNSLQVDEELDVSLILKPKRSYSKDHSDLYSDFLKNLSAHGVLKICEPSFNLFDLVSASQFVICIPYTSPAVIAMELNVPVCYFSTSPGFDLLESVDGIPVHKSLDALRQHIEKSITAISCGFSEGPQK